MIKAAGSFDDLYLCVLQQFSATGEFWVVIADVFAEADGLVDQASAVVGAISVARFSEREYLLAGAENVASAGKALLFGFELFQFLRLQVQFVELFQLIA